MELIDRARYDECIGIAANIRHAAYILDAFESFDEELVTDDEFEGITEACEKLEKLAVIVSKRAEMYLVGV